MGLGDRTRWVPCPEPMSAAVVTRVPLHDRRDGHSRGLTLAHHTHFSHRAIVFLLRLAAASRRAFLINQTHPAPMESFLQPSGILDWTPDPRIPHPVSHLHYDVSGVCE